MRSEPIGRHAVGPKQPGPAVAVSGENYRQSNEFCCTVVVGVGAGLAAPGDPSDPCPAPEPTGLSNDNFLAPCDGNPSVPGCGRVLRAAVRRQRQRRRGRRRGTRKRRRGRAGTRRPARWGRTGSGRDDQGRIEVGPRDHTRRRHGRARVIGADSRPGDGTAERHPFRGRAERREGTAALHARPRPFQAALEQAKAELARDTAQASNAEAQAKRYDDLFKRGLIPRDQFETQKASVASLQATLAADQAAVDTATLNLQYSSIAAPISGRTGALAVTRVIWCARTTPRRCWSSISSRRSTSASRCPAAI